MKYALLLLFKYLVTQSLSCRGKGYDYVRETQLFQLPRKYPSYYYQKQNGTSLYIPPDLKAIYGRWLIEYVVQKKKQKESGVQRPGPIPLDWVRWGPGDGGNAPPPWSVVQEGYGKPDYCFEPASFGNCTYYWRRWVYNYHTHNCDMFYYSGCGGNMNNFVQKYQCEAECMNVIKPTCDIYGTFEET
ncbi:uncharacterized protein LOC142980131 [Anticarsia gemmatalis]|uniref:uncharacterized protein LOC142980131 n=1 Tax=Anticarsia gemmatalis TaxID=129554 RepID=UPI003F776D08